MVMFVRVVENVMFVVWMIILINTVLTPFKVWTLMQDVQCGISVKEIFCGWLWMTIVSVFVIWLGVWNTVFVNTTMMMIKLVWMVKSMVLVVWVFRAAVNTIIGEGIFGKFQMIKLTSNKLFDLMVTRDSTITNVMIQFIKSASQGTVIKSIRGCFLFFYFLSIRVTAVMSLHEEQLFGFEL